MLVYRFEHKDTGIGPFCPKGHLQHGERWFKWFRWHTAIPLCGMSEDNHFGVDAPQLLWNLLDGDSFIKGKKLKELYSLGYQVVEYEVSDCIMEGRQVIFLRSRARVKRVHTQESFLAMIDKKDRTGVF